MACPSCGQTGMIFEGHHGMEHNVCENCGTVIECDAFTVDIYQKGCREVSPDYDGKPEAFRSGCSGLANPKSKTYKETLEVMNRLMDGLKLPVPVREAAMNFLSYSRSLNKLGSVGACVYLAMKDSYIPITIRYISNYLQISHYLIGRIMRKLEKRMERNGHGNIFAVEDLIPLIFNQAKFGPEEEGKRRLDLMLDKTEKLIHLLQECQATTGYEPHLIILAAGFLAWKSLKIHNWDELSIAKGKVPQQAGGRRMKLPLFLSEMGIQLSNLRALCSKVKFIMELLYKLAEQIPWLSVKNLSRDVVLFYLNDFLKYKSQIIEMTAREMEKDKNITLEQTNMKMKEEEEVNEKCDSHKTSTNMSNSCLFNASSTLVIENISTCENQTNDISSLLGEEKSVSNDINIGGQNIDLNCSGTSCTVNMKLKSHLDGLDIAASELKADPSNDDSFKAFCQHKGDNKIPNDTHMHVVEGNSSCAGLNELNGSALRKSKFAKIKDILISSFQNEHCAVGEVCTKIKISGEGMKPIKNVETKSNGYNQLLKVTHPEIARPRKRKKKQSSVCNKNRYNPYLSFP